MDSKTDEELEIKVTDEAKKKIISSIDLLDNRIKILSDKLEKEKSTCKEIIEEKTILERRLRSLDHENKNNIVSANILEEISYLRDKILNLENELNDVNTIIDKLNNDIKEIERAKKEIEKIIPLLSISNGNAINHTIDLVENIARQFHEQWRQDEYKYMFTLLKNKIKNGEITEEDFNHNHIIPDIYFKSEYTYDTKGNLVRNANNNTMEKTNGFGLPSYCNDSPYYCIVIRNYEDFLDKLNSFSDFFNSCSVDSTSWGTKKLIDISKLYKVNLFDKKGNFDKKRFSNDEYTKHVLYGLRRENLLGNFDSLSRVSKNILKENVRYALNVYEMLNNTKCLNEIDNIQREIGQAIHLERLKSMNYDIVNLMVPYDELDKEVKAVDLEIFQMVSKYMKNTFDNNTDVQEENQKLPNYSYQERIVLDLLRQRKETLDDVLESNVIPNKKKYRSIKEEPFFTKDELNGLLLNYEISTEENNSFKIKGFAKITILVLLTAMISIAILVLGVNLIK